MSDFERREAEERAKVQEKEASSLPVGVWFPFLNCFVFCHAFFPSLGLYGMVQPFYLGFLSISCCLKANRVRSGFPGSKAFQRRVVKVLVVSTLQYESHKTKRSSKFLVETRCSNDASHSFAKGQLVPNTAVGT